jgi:hypothetical protein
LRRQGKMFPVGECFAIASIDPPPDTPEKQGTLGKWLQRRHDDEN